MHDLGPRDRPSTGSRQHGNRTCENPIDSPRQRGLRHRIQPSRRWSRYVRLGGRRRLCQDVRPSTSGALDDNLRGPPAHAAAKTRLEQAGSKLPGHRGDGCLRGDYS